MKKFSCLFFFMMSKLFFNRNTLRSIVSFLNHLYMRIIKKYRLFANKTLCIADFDLKDLTFWVFGVTIQLANGHSLNNFCWGSIFMTTYRPTVFFGALGNSGLGSAEECGFPSEKGRKKLFLAEIAFIGPFGSIDGISDVYRCQPPKAL